MVVILSCLVMAGCSDGMMNDPGNEIPVDLRNTVWSKQIGSSTAQIEFGGDCMTVSGTDQYDGRCRFRSYGNGCCGFRNNNDTDIDFEYTCAGNTLTIWNCNNPAFNGDWTKL
jgi:hypothetical protein